MAERQQDHFGSPMATGACEAARGEREGKGEERKRFFFLNRWLHRISRILAVLGYEGIKKATPVVLHPKRKSSAHSL